MALVKCGYTEHADCFARTADILCGALTRGRNERPGPMLFHDDGGAVRDCPFYKSQEQVDYEEIEESVRMYGASHGNERGGGKDSEDEADGGAHEEELG